MEKTASSTIATATRPPAPRRGTSGAPAAPALATSESERKFEAAREVFVSCLASNGLRRTHQRMTIFETAFERSGHYTAEALFTEARQRDASISRATVYRTLPILVANGLVNEVDIGSDSKYYLSARDKNTFQAQIICPDCDAITETDAPFMEWYGKTLSAKFGLELVSQRLQVIARCPTCVAKYRAQKAAK